MDIKELAAKAFDARQTVKMLELMNIPLDYLEAKKAFIELSEARLAANKAEFELNEALKVK